jgi:hypothetical protein
MARGQRFRIRCGGPGCSESVEAFGYFGAATEESLRLGWGTLGGRRMCPACRSAARDPSATIRLFATPRAADVCEALGALAIRDLAAVGRADLARVSGAHWLAVSEIEALAAGAGVRMPEAGGGMPPETLDPPTAEALALRGEDIRAVGLSTRAENACLNCGVEQVSQLAGLRRSDVSRLKNVGRKSAEEIECLMRRAGLRWADAPHLAPAPRPAGDAMPGALRARVVDSVRRSLGNPMVVSARGALDELGARVATVAKRELLRHWLRECRGDAAWLAGRCGVPAEQMADVARSLGLLNEFLTAVYGKKGGA